MDVAAADNRLFDAVLEGAQVTVEISRTIVASSVVLAATVHADREERDRLGENRQLMREGRRLMRENRFGAPLILACR